MADFDFSEVKERIERLGRLVAGELEYTPERTRRVLEERARAIAESTEGREVSGLPVIVFESAGERYALEARHVLSVGRLERLTIIPGAEPPVLGAVAWGGLIVTVLDFRHALGSATSATSATAQDGLIIVGTDRPIFAILCADLPEYATLDPASLTRSPADPEVKRFIATSITPDALTLLDGDELIRAYL